MILFIQGGQITDSVSHAPMAHFPIGGLDKTKLVDPRIAGERSNQTDVGPFWRLDGTDAAIVGGMHIAHLEASTFSRETARSQGRKAPLMSNLGQRIGLIQELGKLAGTKELLQGC